MLKALKSHVFAVALALVCALTGSIGWCEPALGLESAFQPGISAASSWDSSRYGTALGSLGFFNWQADNYETGSKANMDLIIAELTGQKTSYTNDSGQSVTYTPVSLQVDEEGNTFISYTKLGAANDCTSLENMKSALEWLKKGNELRSQINAQYGLTQAGQTTTDADGISHTYLKPFLVSDYCMVASQIRTNWSSSHLNHASANYALGENLAWNYGNLDPYTQWYDNEFAYVQSVKAAHPNDANWEKYIVWSQAGHYYNFIDQNSVTVGFAVNTSGALFPNTYGETFTYRTDFAPVGGKSLTVDEYYERFMTYYNLVREREITMYRLYNPNSGEHFYTSSVGEKSLLVAAGWRAEGVAWIAPASSTAPVYRLYSGGDHHYTASEGERDLLVAAGWKYEGIGWYSDTSQTSPIYRQYNPNAKSGAHNFTSSTGERDLLVAAGWNDEGIAWYGLS